MLVLNYGKTQMLVLTITDLFTSWCKLYRSSEGIYWLQNCNFTLIPQKTKLMAPLVDMWILKSLIMENPDPFLSYS